jgi:hypothetical protein
MRNRELHDALRDFALESAALLTAAVQAGAELPYDVLEEPGTGSVLYRYQPLTAEFIGARWDSLHAEASFTRAANALGAGAETYLRVRGLPGGADAEPALRAMLERLYEDATGFEFPEERFERVYAEVERTLYENTVRAAVVAPVVGLALEDDSVDLGGGMVLARGDKVPAPPEAVWPLTPGDRELATGPNAVCVLERDVESGGPLPAGEARMRFRRLLTAMRLLKPGKLMVGPLAWGRADEGAWQPIGLPFGSAGRGEPWVLTAAEAPELGELLELLSAARLPGRIAWALARFEMGCERTSEADALSDHLLALRALLDTEDEAGRASLGRRLAALCAEEPQRPAVRTRLETAFALERRAMSGVGIEPEPDDGDVEATFSAPRELEQNVRALLRDVICGYLSSDLRSVADDILLATADPSVEIQAHDIRDEPEDDPAGFEPPRPEDREEAPEGLQGELDWDEVGAPDPPDRRMVSRPEAHSADGPGTAADPRAAHWAVASLPGPRTKRRVPSLFFARTEPEEAAEPDQDAAQGLDPDALHPLDEAMASAAAKDRDQDLTVADEPMPVAADAGVTPSADWDDYSAPI